MHKGRKDPSWRHPVHARGIKSPQFSGATTPLTNKKIDQYILQGRYGEEEKNRLIEERKKQKKKIRFVFEDVLKRLLGK